MLRIAWNLSHNFKIYNFLLYSDHVIFTYYVYLLMLMFIYLFIYLLSSDLCCAIYKHLYVYLLFII